MKRYAGDVGLRLKDELIRHALQEHATTYEGSVVLVPGAVALAKKIGRSVGFLYTGENSSYEETLERSTGFSIIHKGGFVLAKEIDIDLLDQSKS